MPGVIRHSLLASVFVSFAMGCGGTDDAAPTSTVDAATSSDTASPYGKVTVKVNYGGTRKGQIAIGVFTEAEPKSRPPVVFDTSKIPAFPYAATLPELEPGRYWIVAVVDFDPFSGAAVKPGPEDLQATSMPVDVVAGQTKSVELTVSDAPADAGTSDAAMD